MTQTSIEQFLIDNEWEIVHELTIPPREAKFTSIDDLDLSKTTIETLKKLYPNGLYFHQKLALKFIKKGENVCLTTGTASGKSLVFLCFRTGTFNRKSKSKNNCNLSA